MSRCLWSARRAALALAAVAAAAAAESCASLPRIARAFAALEGALASRGYDDTGLRSELSASAPLDDGFEAELRDGALELRARTCDGVMHGAFRLSRHVGSRLCAHSGDLGDCLRRHPRLRDAATALIVDAPALASRLYADWGQMLDAPDRGFYAPDGSLNASRVQSDVDRLTAMIPYVQSLGITGMSFESSGIEDYISYDRLGSGTEVYGAGDLHRPRADAWAVALGNFTGTLKAEGLKSYMMIFDIMFPPALAARYNVTSVHSPDLPTVLEARFAELFARVPSLDGLVVYVVDSWAPRAGYEFTVLWTSVEELALTATLYYNALAAAAPGKDLVFSLWIPCTPLNNAWAVLKNNTPPGLTVLVNDGQGDFLWSHGINDILASGAARDRRLFVVADAFREYDGMGRLLSSPIEQWSQRLQVAASTGAQGLMIAAEWSPGNTWPDSGPELINYTAADGYKSWIGLWNRFRIAQLRDYGLFSPSEANVAALAELAWDPTQDPLTLLAAWAAAPPLSLQPLAADLVAAAFNVSGSGWEAKYIADVDEYAIEWSTCFTPKYAPNPESVGAGLLSLFTNATLAEVLAANARVTGAFGQAVALVEQALGANGTSTAGGPLSNEAVAAAGAARAGGVDAGAGLLLGAQKTLAHGAIVSGFRAAAFANNSLAGEAPGSPALRASCAALAAALAALEVDVPAFGELYAEESAAWNVASADPNLDSRPYFWRLNERTVADWLPLFRANMQARCSGSKPRRPARA